MKNLGIREEEIAFDVAGEPRTALVQVPDRLLTPPILLIALACDRRATLDGDIFRIVPDLFLAAGCRVASFDLPYHGDRAVENVEGFTAMARAVARGEDVFTDIRRTGRALIDLCIARGYARAGLIALDGTSRGGLSALHLMAADPRILGACVHAPVTHLPALTEFQDLAANEIVQRSNALALVEYLADRPLYLDGGVADPRVGAQYYFELHAHLMARARTCPPVLFTAPGESHGNGTYPAAIGHAAVGSLLLHRCLEQARG